MMISPLVEFGWRSPRHDIETGDRVALFQAYLNPEIRQL